MRGSLLANTISKRSSEKVPPPPGVAVVARRTALDPHYEAQYGERVRYVIIRGSRTKLVDRARDPLEVLNDRFVDRI